MYTFNLSRVQKQAQSGKVKPGANKKDGPIGIPAGEDAIDIKPIDMQAKPEEAKTGLDTPAAASSLSASIDTT